MRRHDPRPTSTQAGGYPSLANFYIADERRIHSRELDVGLWWREKPDDPLHRAAWIKDTGELYLVRLGPEAEGGGRVEVLATVADRGRMEDLLEGWRERCGEPSSLSWLRRRVARGSAAARSRMTRQPVLGNRLPGHSRIDELPVLGADARITVKRAQAHRHLLV
jgi:hypothetical protein